MGNFCGKKPQKSHLQQRDSMLRNHLSNYFFSSSTSLKSFFPQPFSKFHPFFNQVANMIPNINDDIINRLVDQWQGSVIAYFKSRFKEYASKEENSLDQHDFIKIFPQLASFPKNVKKKAFDFFDRDRSGKIDFKEFCQSLSVCCKSDVHSKIQLLFMLFDTDSDKYLSRNEVQTMIKYCQHYIFKIRMSDLVNPNNITSQDKDQLSLLDQQQRLSRPNQITQIDRLSQTQGNIVINDGYIMPDNIKILSKTTSKELAGAQETASNLTSDKKQKQQQSNQKEIQKKQQLLKAQQEKETMAYLFSKKQDKISYQCFYNWAIEYFNIEEFFLMFELVPDPLLERDIIRAIIKEESSKDRQINKLLLEQRQKQIAEDKQQEGGINEATNQDGQKNNKKNNSNNNKQNKQVGNISEKQVQKERFTETIYVVSWKWWFMWKYYINYAYKIKKLQNSRNQEKNANNNSGGGLGHGEERLGKNETNAVNYTNLKNSPLGVVNKQKQDAININNNSNKAMNDGQQGGQQKVGLIGEEEEERNDFSNIANHQLSNNNTFFNSKENMDSNNNSPTNKKRKDYTISPGRRDSNNSRNSMVDLEFNNSIPSERQEEQRVKYHLQPNAFKNNLEFNLRNYQDSSSQNDLNLDPQSNIDQQQNEGQQNNNRQYHQQYQGQGQSGHQQNYHHNNRVFGGEEDIISDHNLFRPYSPSKVNHDLNNFAQAQQMALAAAKNQSRGGSGEKLYDNQNRIPQVVRNDNQDDQGEGDEAMENYHHANLHNQPQESQVRSVSHHHQFQQGCGSNVFTPRQNQQQNYNQDASGYKQLNFSSIAAEKQLLTNLGNQKDINDSDLFQNPNWNNQLYENTTSQSPNKFTQYNDTSGKKGLIHPQQVQSNYQQRFNQMQNTNRSDQLDFYNNQGGQIQSTMNSPQLLNYPETPQSTAGMIPTTNERQGKEVNSNILRAMNNTTQQQVAEHNFIAHHNDIEAISQNNSHNHYQNLQQATQNNGSNINQLNSNIPTAINQKQQSGNNDNQTMYHEVLHPETRGMNQSSGQQFSQFYLQQQDKSAQYIDEFNIMPVEQSERVEYGVSPQDHVQQYNQRSVYAGQMQSERNQPTVNPNLRGNINQIMNKNEQVPNQHQFKNTETPSTLFSQTKFNICKPLQGLQGETHDLLSQDDLSKSNIAAAATNKNINNINPQFEQSQFAREQQNNSPSLFQNKTSLSPRKFDEIIQTKQESLSPEKKQLIQQDNTINTTLNTQNNIKKSNDNNYNNVVFHADKMLHDDYMDEIDKGIQNTEEFGEHEEEEDHKRVHDDHIRFNQNSGHNLGDRPTQIDNTDLEGEFQGELQKNILRNNDYVIIPEKAWEKLFGWYSGGPTFKRKRIVDIQKNYKTVELYPPLVIGYKCRKNGEINYDSRQELMVSSWKTLKDVMKKFQKYFKSEKQEDILYFKKMASSWKKANDLDKTMLIDLQIESGTIFLFLTKSLEEKFIEKQRQKSDVQGANSLSEIIDSYEVGDKICIFHPSERIEKKGYIFQIKNDAIQIHFKRESFRNDIIFEKKQLENYIRLENNQNSQINIEQSITHLNHHIKYNPKMIGLANLGNTCFINCIIQFLVHTPFFRQYLLDEIYLDSFKESTLIGNPLNLGNSANANGNSYNQVNNNNNNPFSPTSNNSNIYSNQNDRNQGNLDLQAQISLIRELSHLAKFLKQKPYNDILDPVRPSNLKTAIDKLMPNFSGHEQHDAQEFLQGFLDKLNDEIKIKKLVTISKQEEINNTIPTTLSNQTNNQNTRPTNASTIQAQQLSKQSFSVKQENVNIIKEKSHTKTSGEEIFNTQPPSFPPEPISNLPLQPAISSQQQTDPIIETIPNQKRDSGDKSDLQIKPTVQEYQEFSIIKDVYMGQTINSIQCQACGNVNHKYEDFFTLSLPLPIKNEILYEVTYVPRIHKGNIKPIKKFGIKLHRSATYGEFQQAFYKTSKINPSNIVFAEIYKNNIFRNLYATDSYIPMRNLGIRSNDEITAFEVITTNNELEKETNSLYPHNNYSAKQSIKEQDFVDFNISSNKWVHGQVEKIAQGDNKNEQIVQIKILDESLKQHTYTQRLKADSKRIYPFRSQIPFYPKEKGYVVFLVNRRKMNNSMERFGIPLCIIIPSWLTWKELHLLIFSQVQRCIDFNYLIKKHQAAAKAQTKSKIKSAKTQGYTQLGGEQEEQDNNNNAAANTYQNYENRAKEKSYYEQQQYIREYRQKAPSFHGFIEDIPQNQPVYEEDEYMRNRKSLFNYQQEVGHSSKSPTRNQYYNEDDPPQLRVTSTDYQNIFKANTSTHIQQQYNPESYQINGVKDQKNEGQQNSNIKKNFNKNKQSVNLESMKKTDNFYQNQSQPNLDEYFSAFNGEIKDTIDFLQSSYFPYKLRIIEQATHRCVICDLPLLPDNTSREFCQGCEPGLVERPIFWDIKQVGLLFAIDWKDSLSFNPSSMIPQNDQSFIDLKKQKNEIKMGIPIQACFNLFSTQEKVELECDICKVNQIQSTKHQIYKLPNILIIHLSRFQYQNGLFEKIDDLVNFPIKRLDLSQWVFKDNKLQQNNQQQQPKNENDEKGQSQQSQQQVRYKNISQDQSEIYDLFSVINHLGNGHGGHYTSFVNIKEDGTESKDCWVNFDDEQVSYINQEDVVSNKGYLLVYKKKFSTSAIVNLTYKKL